MERTTANFEVLNPLFTLATVVLIVLKLAGVLAISWWLVFLPLIIAAGLSVVGFLLITGILCFVVRNKK